MKSKRSEILSVVSISKQSKGLFKSMWKSNGRMMSCQVIFKDFSLFDLIDGTP